jgi:hypothetical protein
MAAAHSSPDVMTLKRQPLEERKGERRSGKACVVDRTAGMVEQASTFLSICLSDPQGRDEAVA